MKLAGKASNRDGIGAKVTVTAGGRERFAEMTTSPSYLSTVAPRLHFGLGGAKKATVKVEWPSGVVQTAEFEANRIVTIEEAPKKTPKKTPEKGGQK
ncbi:MAG: ASPIC/UnbV domain-containing protein [Planctomycetota bacterium]